MTPGRRGQRGFTMVGVVVAIAIIVILLAAVGPTVSTIIERDREKELIFRGRQFARAVLAFQKRYGRFPNELKELSKMKPRSIRKLWKDPMCNCDDWQVIIAGTPEAVPMGAPPPPGGSGPGFNRTPRPGQTTPGFGGFGDELTPTPGFLGGGGGRVPVTPTPSSSSSFGPQTGQTVGPIMGVRTKVRRKTVFEWRGRSYTDEWRFIAGDADNENGAPVFDPNILRGPHYTPPPSGNR